MVVSADAPHNEEGVNFPSMGGEDLPRLMGCIEEFLPGLEVFHFGQRCDSPALSSRLRVERGLFMFSVPSTLDCVTTPFTAEAIKGGA